MTTNCFYVKKIKLQLLRFNVALNIKYEKVQEGGRYIFISTVCHNVTSSFVKRKRGDDLNLTCCCRSKIKTCFVQSVRANSSTRNPINVCDTEL